LSPVRAQRSTARSSSANAPTLLGPAWHSRRPHQRHCGTGIWRDRDIAAGWRDLETPCASLPTRSPSQPRTAARKAGVLDPRKQLRERDGLSAGGRWIRTFGSRTRHQAVRPRRGRFPVIGSSPHWPGGTGISNLRPLAGWISALERGRFQGHKQKRKLKSVAPFARNRKFESISLQQRVGNELFCHRTPSAARRRQRSFAVRFRLGRMEPPGRRVMMPATRSS
jgi:hypothetical protein